MRDKQPFRLEEVAQVIASRRDRQVNSTTRLVSKIILEDVAKSVTGKLDRFLHGRDTTLGAWAYRVNSERPTLEVGNIDIPTLTQQRRQADANRGRDARVALGLAAGLTILGVRALARGR